MILGNAKQYSDMKFLDILREGQDRTDLSPDFCGDVLYVVPPTHVDKFISLHSGCSFVSRVSISAYRQNSEVRRTNTQKIKCFSSRLAAVFAQPIEARFYVANERAMLRLHLSDQQFHCLSRCGLYQRFDGICHFDNALFELC